MKKFSNYDVTWAVRDSRLVTKVEHHILMVLASRGDKHAPETCHPSIECIAADCGLSTRHVQRAIGRLVKANILRIVARPKMTNVFVINVAKLQKSAEANRALVVASRALTPVVWDDEPDSDGNEAPVLAEPERKPRKNPLDVCPASLIPGGK